MCTSWDPTKPSRVRTVHQPGVGPPKGLSPHQRHIHRPRSPGAHPLILKPRSPCVVACCELAWSQIRTVRHRVHSQGSSRELQLVRAGAPQCIQLRPLRRLHIKHQISNLRSGLCVGRKAVKRLPLTQVCSHFERVQPRVCRSR